MKHILVFALSLGLSTALAQTPPAPTASTSAPGAPAPPPGATSDPLAGLLARIPAQSADAQTKLLDDLLKLDAVAFKTLCDRVVDPGAGDDAKVRMAIHGVVLAAGRPEAQARRAEIEGILLAQLAAKAPAGAQDFLLEQLRFIASPACVSTVSNLLGDETHVTRAAMVLATVGDDSAKLALRSALAAAAGKTRLPILHALGVLKDGDGLTSLVAGADPQDVEAWRTLLFALAASGHPAMADLAAKLLGPGAEAADPVSGYAQGHDRAIALGYLRNAGERQGAAAAASALRACTAKFTDPVEVHVRCAALAALADVAGAEALPDLLAALNSDDVEYRAAASRATVRLSGEGVTPALAAALVSASSEGKASLLDILARRGDPAAFDACAGELAATEPLVRLAAIDAAARLGGEKAVPAMLPLLDTEDAAQFTAVQQSLFEQRDAAIGKTLAEALEKSGPHVKRGILEALGRRGAADQMDRVMMCVSDPMAEVSVAAWKALGALAPPSAANAMLERFSATVDDAVREAAASAIAASCGRNEDKVNRAAPIIAALKHPSPAHFASLLHALARIGGTAALAAVRDQVKHPQTEIREAAIAALCDWPDAEALPECLNLARNAAETKEHVLAMRAHLRLLETATGLPAEERLRAYAIAIDACRRSDEKKLAFSGVAKLGNERGLELLKPYLFDTGAGAEAAQATVQLADRIIPARCAEARAALTSLSADSLPEPVSAELSKALERLAKFEDHVTDWYVSGPYLQKDKRGQDLINVPFPPEDPKAKGVIWREPAPAADAGMAWAVDLNATPAVAGDMRAAYLRTRVYSPTAQLARMEVGSDDGIKVWLNGECVHTNNALRGCTPSADVVEIKLKEGWNDLLLKVTNDGGGWFGAARLRGASGEHLDGVYAKRGFVP